MWDVDNQTRYTHAHSWDRDRDGAETWIVVVKGTFDILPGGAVRAADEQLAVTELPVFRDAPDRSSLVLDTDLLRTKPTTDILVRGHAHAPGGRAVTALDVTLRTDAFTKRLRVVGDREIKRVLGGWRHARPRPFSSLPLRYERAYGGSDSGSSTTDGHRWDERNPAGKGFAIEDGCLAPNIVYPEDDAAVPGTPLRPAGFGPIAAHWLPRRRWSGTFDQAWHRERKPLVPDDQDDRFHLCAPADQQPPRHYSGGETIALHNMTPDGLLAFHVPRVHLGFETHFHRGKPVRHRPSLHTIVVEPDERRVSLVWQTSLRCHAHVLELDRTEVIEKALPLRA